MHSQAIRGAAVGVELGVDPPLGDLGVLAGLDRREADLLRLTVARLVVRGVVPRQDALDRPPNSICQPEEHTSELQSHSDLVCRLLLEKKKGDGTVDEPERYDGVYEQADLSYRYDDRR